MTKSTVPTETLKGFIKGQGYGVAPSAVVAICEELLAVREAQSVPVAWQAESKVRCNRMTTLNKEVAADWAFKGFTVTPLFTAPPAPAVNNLILVAQRLVGRYIANKGTTSEFIACVTPEKRSIGTGGTWDDWRLLDAALNACRAAMLQPVSDPYKLPFGVVPIQWIGVDMAKEMYPAPKGGDDE